jgi:hypothetical protein
MKRILTFGAMLIMASCATVPSPEMAERHSHADAQRVKKSLAAITIPEANLKEVTADCAVTFWITATQENDPQHRGVSTISQGGTDCRVSIMATNLSALALLNEICLRANGVRS